jgi:hypothetical protein
LILLQVPHEVERGLAHQFPLAGNSIGGVFILFLIGTASISDGYFSGVI